MNKYFVLIIIILLIVAGGLFYRFKLLPADQRPVNTGQTKEITIVAKKNEWRFVPGDVTIERGDRVLLTLVNEDDYDHGFGLEDFGISQKMPALTTVKTKFVATQAGSFTFFCSVPCGEGDVNGEHRDHYDMTGVIQVIDSAGQ